jgi:hypothetical protein
LAHAAPGVKETTGYGQQTQCRSGGIGHNLPQEAPQAFAQAVVDADRY